MFVVKDAVREPLYAIVPYFNPWRWKSREKHTLRALKHFADAGATVVLVEAAFNRREFTFADSGLAETGKHIYVPIRTRDELWLKENLINIAVSRLPYNWQQICWLDSDIQFVRPNWVGETIHKLQHYSFLQMFSHARDVGPDYALLPSDYPHADGPSWMKAYADDELPLQRRHRKHHHHKHHHHHHYPGPCWPGLAWACTRPAFDAVGGLLDFAVWGGGDWHMAHALIEEHDGMMRTDLSPGYQRLVMEWADRCRIHIRKNVGFMEGTVLHNWHGRKTERGYNAKHTLLANLAFDPIRHLKRDFQGVWQLHDDGSDTFVGMRDIMRTIARERNEDSIDVYSPSEVQGH